MDMQTIAKTTLKRNKIEFLPSEFKICSKAKLIRTIYHWNKDSK